MKDTNGNNYNRNRHSGYSSSRTPSSDAERQPQKPTGHRKYSRNADKRDSAGTSEHRYTYNNIPVRSVNEEIHNQQYSRPYTQTPSYRQSQNSYPVGYNHQPQRYAPSQSYNGYSQDYYNPNPRPVQPANGQSGYAEEAAQHMPPQTPKRKNRKSHGFLKFLISILLIVSVLCGATFGYAYSLCSKTNYVKSESRITASDVMYDDGIYNVLLVGTDKESGGVSRSDTMMLLSIDKKQEKLRMVSFLRDMWVEIPNQGRAKLNAAFAYGGADLMMQTIENNFKIRIDNYILVDFDMFKALIDGLGGVDVDITENEAKFINRTSHAKVKSGINHLDGDYALIYVRIRKLDSDFMRTQRQRKVMNSILNQIKKKGIFNAVSTATDVLPYITTDINAFNLTVKAFEAVKYIGYESDQMQIPLDGAFTDKRIDGQAALKVDFEKNIEELQKFLYE